MRNILAAAYAVFLLVCSWKFIRYRELVNTNLKTGETLTRDIIAHPEKLTDLGLRYRRLATLYYGAIFFSLILFAVIAVMFG